MHNIKHETKPLNKGLSKLRFRRISQHHQSVKYYYKTVNIRIYIQGIKLDDNPIQSFVQACVINS